MTTITKSLTNDFGGNFFLPSFEQEIRQSPEIQTTLVNVTFSPPDTININFATPPTEQELERGILGAVVGHNSQPAVWKFVPADFPNGFNIAALQLAIKANNTFGGNNFDGIISEEEFGSVKLMFNTLPDAAGLVTLSDICVNYNQVVPAARIHEQVIPIKNESISDLKYSLVARFQYNGVNKTIDYIDIVAYSLTGTYDLRIVNARTKQVMATITNQSNRSFDIISLTSFSNVPSDNSLLELYARVASGVGPVIVDQATLWYH